MIDPAVDPTQHWQDRANCIGADPDLFFPVRGADAKPAKEICAACEVKQECLDFAMTSPMMKFGIWGGTSERERKHLRHLRSVGE